MDFKEVRDKFPQYGDLSDEQLGKALHSKFYSDVPYEQFAVSVGLTKQQKIGAEGFPQAMREAVAGASSSDRFLSSVYSTMVDQPALRLKQLATGVIPPPAQRTWGSQDDLNVAASREMASGSLPGAITGAVAGPVGRAMSVAGPALAGGGMLAPAAGGAAMGAATNFLANPTLQGESEAMNVGMGALGGAAGGVGAQVLSHVARPIQNVSQSAQRFLADKVRMTPGQASGGLINKLEQQLESWPVIGWMISHSRDKSIKSMNLDALYKTVPEGQKAQFKQAGRAAIESAKGLVDDAYDAAYARITNPVNVDKTFQDAIRSIPTREGIDLPDSLVDRFNTLINDRVYSRIGPNSPASAETIRDVNNSLGALSRRFRTGNNDADTQALGRAFAQAKEQLRFLIGRSGNTEVKSVLDKLDDKYSMLKAIEKASGYASSKDGVFSGSSLNRATQRSTRDVRSFGQAAGDVFGPSVPDSGTAGRVLLPWVLGGAASGNHFMEGPGWLTAALATPLMFSGPAGRYVAGGFPGQAQLSELIRGGIPAAAQAGRIIGNQQ